MRSALIQQIPESACKSPKGVYHHFQKNVSLTLGGRKDVGLWGGGHPFDLAWIRVPPGSRNWPLHRHSEQWEMYYILEGEGRYFDGENWNEICVGQIILSTPEENHQIENTGTQDLTYLVIANMPEADRIFYPDTGRTFIKPGRRFLDATSADYYAGHE